jgi:hypothetical protein
VNETSDWQRFGNCVSEVTCLLKGSRIILFIADIPAERASTSQIAFRGMAFSTSNLPAPTERIEQLVYAELEIETSGLSVYCSVLDF